MPRWTKEQQEAIDLEGSNILVSAGAGSGKTAVLTARVLRKLKEGISIQNLLILTFTKAAASEMRERIRDAITKEGLEKELDYIDSAYITTFDSFALSVVKKYHDVLNVSKSISVLDDTIVKTYKKHELETIFEEEYQKENPEFLKLIRDFCMRDDEVIKEMILNLSSKLDLLPNKIEYLKNYEEKRFSDVQIQKDLEDYIRFLKEKREEFKEQIELFETYVDGSYYEKLVTSFEPFFQADTYEELYQSKDISFPRLPRGLDESVKQKKTELSELWKTYSSYLSFETLEDLKHTILKTKDYVHAIIEILLLLEDKVQAYKKEKDAYEFSDIAIMAIELVQKKKEVREELKHSFQEIMIDEYQDTNDLQELFIKEISNHNVYMVGDIKQSIYRFRNANPSLFGEKYDLYSKKEDGIKIDLNKNFRSRKEVLEDINSFFCYFMDEKIGGANYRETHQMIFGNQVYEEEKASQNNHFEVYHYHKDAFYKEEEIEAFIVAKDIQKKVNGSYLVLDKETQKLRPICYSDCAILMDRSTHFSLYKKVFEYLGIPLTLYKDEKITNENDIYVLKNILKFMNKIKKKEFDQEFEYCFVSIARSFLYSMKDEEILTHLENHSIFQTEIYQKAFEIVKEYDSISIRKILEKIFPSFDFYKKLITVGDVSSAFVRLEYVGNIAENLTSLGYTIYDFTDYLEEMIEEQKDVRYPMNVGEGDSVKLMTIHKSKGLEFPICYFTGLSKKFNLREMKERFLYDSIYGIITPYYEEGIGSTFYKDLIQDRMIKEEISERIRLFYVALTRAREKMIFVTPMKEGTEIEKKNHVLPTFLRLHYRSFEDMLVSITPILESNWKEIPLESLSLTTSYKGTKKGSILDQIEEGNTFFQFQEQKEQSSSYETHHYSKESIKLLKKEEKENMEFGTKLHEILEYLDFKNPSLDGISPFLKEKINLLLRSPILTDLEHAKVYQEYAFYEQETHSNGVIDLMLEWSDHISIIDYKLKNLDEKAYQKQLQGYQSYIEKKTGKKVSIYLYSLLTGEIKTL